MTPLRVSGKGKLGDEMELPLDVPKDPNYESDRDEFLVKNSTLHSLIPLGSGRIVLKMTQPQTDPASRPDSAKLSKLKILDLSLDFEFSKLKFQSSKFKFQISKFKFQKGRDIHTFFKYT